MKQGAKCGKRECVRDDMGAPPALKVKLSEGQIEGIGFNSRIHESL
jgi:hypothetical protein